MTMKKQYSYFDKLCAVSYLSLCANHPGMARFTAVRRCAQPRRNDH